MPLLSTATAANRKNPRVTYGLTIIIFHTRATEEKNPMSDLRMHRHYVYNRGQQKRRIQRVICGWPVNIFCTRATKEKSPKGDLRLGRHFLPHT